eukprot:2371549-Lingulodinium_polyedra.AAC.1
MTLNKSFTVSQRSHRGWARRSVASPHIKHGRPRQLGHAWSGSAGGALTGTVPATPACPAGAAAAAMGAAAEGAG